MSKSSRDFRLHEDDKIILFNEFMILKVNTKSYKNIKGES